MENEIKKCMDRIIVAATEDIIKCIEKEADIDTDSAISAITPLIHLSLKVDGLLQS